MEPKRSQRISIYEGLLAVVFINWTTGLVTTGYALYLGASPAALSFLGALPLLAQLASPLAPLVRGSPGRLTVRLVRWGRTLFLPVLFSAFLPPPWRLANLLFWAALSQLVQAPAGVLWTSWMADLVPEGDRGRYFGYRNAVTGLVGTLANLAAGALLDVLSHPLGFVLILGIGMFLGLLSPFLMALQHDPPPRAAHPRLGELLAPLLGSELRPFLLFLAGWNGAVMVGSPLVFPYFLQDVRMDYLQASLYTLISAAVTLVLGPLWGRIADRRGHRWVLLEATLVAGLLPLGWLLGAHGRLAPIYLTAFFDGGAWSAITPALVNFGLQWAPPARRTVYLALYGVAGALGGLLGSLLGGALGDLGGYRLALLASAAARLAMALSLRLVPALRAPGPARALRSPDEGS